MCTALTLRTGEGQHLFGRNMDLEYNFNQQVTLVPRNFEWCNHVTEASHTGQYAVMGIGTVVGDHPLLAEGMNEKGLACAGLNFPGYASYEEAQEEGKINLGPYDFIYWILSTFETLQQVKEKINELQLINKPFAPGIPVVPLHWIITDCSGESIIVEKTKKGLQVYDNTVGILSNSPTFEWHMTNLQQYMGLQSTQPDKCQWGEADLVPLGQGLGLKGLPGDFTPPSRFVRAAYLRNHIALTETFSDALMAFFHILGNVAMVAGAVVTREGKNDITLYSSCMCLETGGYYYKTYKNAQIQKVCMHQYNLDSAAIQQLGYKDEFKLMLNQEIGSFTREK